MRHSAGRDLVSVPRKIRTELPEQYNSQPLPPQTRVVFTLYTGLYNYLSLRYLLYLLYLLYLRYLRTSHRKTPTSRTDPKMLRRVGREQLCMPIVVVP